MRPIQKSKLSLIYTEFRGGIGNRQTLQCMPNTAVYDLFAEGLRQKITSSKPHTLQCMPITAVCKVLRRLFWLKTLRKHLIHGSVWRLPIPPLFLSWDFLTANTLWENYLLFSSLLWIYIRWVSMFLYCIGWHVSTVVWFCEDDLFCCKVWKDNLNKR